MKKRTSIILIVIGSIILLFGLFFFFCNQYEDYSAGEKSKEILIDIKEEITTNESNDITDIKSEDSIYIDGYSYIGYITIPSINIELPIMDDWSYDKLNLSPCRHFGSITDNNLVIAAHDYKSHFKKISKLKIGDNIAITDINGIQYEYQVEKKDILKSNEVDVVQNSGYDLVLYTCTSDGTRRVTIFCNRVRYE